MEFPGHQQPTGQGGPNREDKMKKKETIILLDKKQSYQITVYGRQGMSIRQKECGSMRSIGIMDSGRISFKGW